MRRALAIVPLLLVLASAWAHPPDDRAQNRSVGGRARRANPVHRLDIVAPRGYRPSDWADRLAGFLATVEENRMYREHRSLYTRFTPQGKVLSLRPELLRSPDRHERTAARQVLRFARENGLKIVPVRRDAEAAGAHAP